MSGLLFIGTGFAGVTKLLACRTTRTISNQLTTDLYHIYTYKVLIFQNFVQQTERKQYVTVRKGIWKCQTQKQATSINQAKKMAEDILLLDIFERLLGIFWPWI